MLTDAQLSKIMPSLAAARRQAFLPGVNAAMHAYAIDTVLRAAAFLGQLAHESGEFRWMEEIWGPTPAQRRYEPVSDLATRLGNSQQGDGARYKGRGPIQITGRFNYKKYGDLLGLDLIARPELVATPAVAFETAGLFWASSHLNELADGQQYELITRRINGGLNGFEDRKMYYERAKQVLAGGTFGEAPPTTRGASLPPTRARIDSLSPLGRGWEVLLDDAQMGGAAGPVTRGGGESSGEAPAAKPSKRPARKVASPMAVPRKSHAAKRPALR